MQRVPRHRLLAALLASMTLLAVAIPPIAGAASTATTCPPGESGPTCELLISAPESVVTGTPFTVQVSVGFWTFPNESQDFAPFFTVANSDACASKVPVRLTISNAFGSAYTPDPLGPTTAAAGIATFTVTIPVGTLTEGGGTDGLYTLTAWAQYPELSSCGNYYFTQSQADVTAISIPADQPIAPCPDNVVCVQRSSGGGSAATLFSIDGNWDIAQFVPQSAVPVDQNGGSMATVCPVLTGQDPKGTLQFSNPTATADKTIVLALNRELVNQGIAQFRICWSGTTLFTPLGGGAQVYTGDLSACSKTIPAPCVLFKKSNKLNTGFFGVLAPFGADNDPYVRPH